MMAEITSRALSSPNDEDADRATKVKLDDDDFSSGAAAAFLDASGCETWGVSDDSHSD